MNLFLLLGQLGLSGQRHAEPLLPIGTVYDPFVCRGLDALIYALYQGARFVVVGTPSGVTLSREGGAHQSVVTPGIGMGLPGIAYAEPAYARETEWLLLDALARLHDPEGESLYLRLSTRPLEQERFEELAIQRGDDLRAEVLAGGYWLTPPQHDTAIVLACAGALVPEVLGAAELLAQEGVGAAVLVASSPDRLFSGWRAAPRRGDSHLEALIPAGLRGASLVTVLDGAPHALAGLGGCLGMATVPLGVAGFGQSGGLPELYEALGLSAEQIAEAALDGRVGV